MPKQSEPVYHDFHLLPGGTWKCVAAAIVLTAAWAAMDRVCDPLLGWPPTNLITTFFAALGGAALVATSNSKATQP